MKRISILQPSYLPWLGYFDQMARSDAFVFLDDVQFTRRDWRNRNKIRVPEGWTWLTVPITQKGKYEQTLVETKIDCSTPWIEKHLKTVRSHYSKTPNFDLYFPPLESILSKRHGNLIDLCLETSLWLKDVLGIKTTIFRSSELLVEGLKGDRILNICRKLGATHYLSGDSARGYLSEDDFSRYNITLEYQEYKHPKYSQRYPGFEAHLSVVDLLFNCGENSLNILSESGE
tara:strand:+ start:3271 stop:3963 length:693 start_codon:yes stop_codon:yes gene_type:complete